MMTNKKSGWAGRTRVGVAIASMLFCSIIIIQCNSTKDDQISPNVGNQRALSDVDLPVLPASGFKFEGDLSNALTLIVSNDALRIGDKDADLSELSRIQDDKHGRELPIIMMVDKDQQMGFVRKVHMTLRVADRRKLLYMGQTSSGERVEVMIILPPDPNSDYLKPDISKIPEENLLKVYIGENDGPAIQKEVYDFVTGFIAKGKGDLPVISAKADDEDSYGDYLSNFFHIKEGYIQIYQERAQKMFKKDFYQTTKDQYKLVRENIPMQVSIAEE